MTSSQHNLKNNLKTRDRLLQAAIAVFSTSGVIGATTREIARVAQVNEVTLFRHFQTKEQLLNAVAEYVSALTTETLATETLATETLPIEETPDLRSDLLRYARLYNQRLEDYEALIRMFIGEAQRHPAEALQVFQQSFQPLREKLVAHLRHGLKEGTVRPELDLAMAIDLFTGMLLSGMLRRHVSSIPRDYSSDRYVEECVDLFVRSISTASPQ